MEKINSSQAKNSSEDIIAGFPAFSKSLQNSQIQVHRLPLEILQVNVGKLCNQACLHCHVEAGPKRKEIMEEKTIDRLLELLTHSTGVHTVDITGGAPELNPYFRKFVSETRKLEKKVIDRCNLTVLFEPGQEETPYFLKEHHVQIVASLPCYSTKNVDQQRGNGVFDKSIRALKLLNSLGYGKSDQNLELNLVYNPLGPSLPPSQNELESQYKKKLFEDFGIEFNHLYTITNMPIKRFLRDLERTGQLETYMSTLIENFNPKAAESVMCRNLVSIGWDGSIYDCDFNQMLEIPAAWKNQSIWELHSLDDFNSGDIAFKNHCYGCTAGAGSSCGGTVA